MKTRNSAVRKSGIVLLILGVFFLPGFVAMAASQVQMDAALDKPVLLANQKQKAFLRVGLELGADDYIVKPFGMRELVARIRAVTRRYLASQKISDVPEDFTMADLEVHPAELRAFRGEKTFDLSLRDVIILTTLFQNKGKAVHRHLLFREAWGVDHIPNSRTLDQTISQLRKRIEPDPQRPTVITTVHGVGYRYEG